MENLSTAEKQKRKTMFCELIEAENKGIHKYVDAIKIAPEHRKMLQSIMNEEFQHIRLLNELMKDLGELPETDSNHSDEHHDDSSEMISNQISGESSSEDSKAQGTIVSFKRSK